MRFLAFWASPLHTREVAGSKPAAPMFRMAGWGWFLTPVAFGSLETSRADDRFGSEGLRSQAVECGDRLGLSA
jgi:hypothetical protein